MGDTTTAIGWLKKSNFTDVDEDDTNTTSKFLAFRWLAILVKKSGACIYSQWLSEADNNMSNCLSRYFQFLNSLLTTLLTSHTNSQLPPNFKIFPLQLEIDSWLCWLLGNLHIKTALQVRLKMSKLAVGIGGQYSSRTSESKTTPSSNPLASLNAAPSSFLPSSKLYKKQAFLTRMTSLWLKE